MRGAAAIATALFLNAQASAAGVLREATIGEPPPLDVMVTTADVASVIGRHIFETLYAWDFDLYAAPHAGGQRSCRRRRQNHHYQTAPGD